MSRLPTKRVILQTRLENLNLFQQLGLCSHFSQLRDICNSIRGILLHKNANLSLSESKYPTHLF